MQYDILLDDVKKLDELSRSGQVTCIISSSSAAARFAIGNLVKLAARGDSSGKVVQALVGAKTNHPLDSGKVILVFGRG